MSSQHLEDVPESLWDRLAQRISKETGAEPLPAPPHQAVEPEWEEAASGIFVKLLATNHERHRVSMLVQLEPDTEYPPHRHAGIEELYLLQGQLMVDDRKLQPGDYIRVPADTVDHWVWSGTGCTCVLITSTEDTLL